MMRIPIRSRAGRTAAVVALVGLGTALAMRTLRSADHRDSPTTTADAAADINDANRLPGR